MDYGKSKNAMYKVNDLELPILQILLYVHSLQAAKKVQLSKSVPSATPILTHFVSESIRAAIALFKKDPQHLGERSVRYCPIRLPLVDIDILSGA